MSTFASSQLICSPSYFKYQLKAVIITVTDKKDNDHHYTFTKYGEQFYRCDDELIEPVDKSVVFERKYSSTVAMYMREKINSVNFVETIGQILSEIEKLNLCDVFDNTHVRMMFGAALELIVSHTKVLYWSYGAVYTCLHCKEQNHLFGTDCILFSTEQHIKKNDEISLDDTLIQTKLVPKIRCKNQCEGYTCTTSARYSVLDIPQFIFVTLATNSIKNKTKLTTTTTDKYKKNIQEQIHIKCDLIQSCFAYSLCCFIVVTKDERILLVKPMTNNQYSVYNHDSKGYEPLINYQFDDFVTASAANIVFCYKAEDVAELDPTLTPTILDMKQWAVMPDLDLGVLTTGFKKYISSFNEPLNIGPYQIKSFDLTQLIKSTHELNDEQLNAHLYVTTTLSDGILLFDPISFAKYCQRGFRKSCEILGKEWFKHNIILVPVHHSYHWLLFIIDINNKTIIFFDSLPSTSTPHKKYQKAIVRLLTIHYFYTKARTMNINKWKLISNFTEYKQDDTTSCGTHCGMFARSYVSFTQHTKINKRNIPAYRMLFATHLLQTTSK